MALANHMPGMPGDCLDMHEDEGERGLCDWEVDFYHRVPQADSMDEQLKKRLRKVDPNISEAAFALINEMIQKTEENATAQVDEVTSNLEALQSKHQTLESEHQTLAFDHWALKSDHQDLKAGHQVLKSGHEALKSEHEALKSKHRDLEFDHQTLKSEYQALEFSSKVQEASLWKMIHNLTQRGPTPTETTTQSQGPSAELHMKIFRAKFFGCQLIDYGNNLREGESLTLPSIGPFCSAFPSSSACPCKSISTESVSASLPSSSIPDSTSTLDPPSERSPVTTATSTNTYMFGPAPTSPPPNLAPDPFRLHGLFYLSQQVPPE